MAWNNNSGGPWGGGGGGNSGGPWGGGGGGDRKSTRLNSSHLGTSDAVFCLKKKKLAADPWRLWHSAPHAVMLRAISGAHQACIVPVRSPSRDQSGRKRDSSHVTARPCPLRA